MSVCALIGASDFNAEQFALMDEAGEFDYVIAVDGGLRSLEEVGRKADLAMGDFDSYGSVPHGLRTVQFSCEKDESDMELALLRAKKLKFTDVVIFGGLGGRLDHTLANISLFAHFSEEGINVCAVGKRELLVFLTGPDVFESPAREEGTVSVFALNDKVKGVFERGLQWELDDVELTNRTSLGLSNAFKGEAVMIGVEEGTIVIFYPLD